MKNQRFDRYIYAGITAILVIIAATAVIFLFWERKSIADAVNRLMGILSPIIYGAVLAFLFSPVYNMGDRAAREAALQVTKNKKLSGMAGKFTGTAVSLAFLYIIVASLAMMIIPQVHSSIVGIMGAMPVYIQNIYEWLTELFANNPPLEETVLSTYQQAVISLQTWASANLIPNIENLEKILGGVSNSVINLFNLAKNLLIGLIVMIYLLNIKDTLTAQG